MEELAESATKGPIAASAGPPLKSIAPLSRALGNSPNALFAMALLMTPMGVARADSSSEMSPDPRDIVGSLSCSSVACHGAAERRTSANGNSQGQEALHWLYDPHSAAGRRLFEPAFQEVIQRASQRRGGNVD